MDTLKVAIIEDQEEIQDGYVFLLNMSAGFECKGYGTGEDALDAFEKDVPDVVLMDINLPGMSGIECTRQIKLKYPDVLIMMFTVYENNDQIFNALAAGASGYILKQASSSELIDAIEEIRRGGSSMSSAIARKVASSFNTTAGSKETELLPREREVLGLIAEGYRYKEIGDKLYISISTVRLHIQKIYNALHVHHTMEALNKNNNKNGNSHS
jgi:DNA-binding NarL/FixJ family response regulator